ncbi:MAG TPA: hypothetical protein VGL77_06270 [Armatimonadota bacterium]
MRFTVAMVAWNLALDPPHLRPKRLVEMMKAIPTDMQLEYKRELMRLIKRKEDDFAQYHWYIVDFEITMKARTFTLSVQTLDPQE